VGQEETGNDQLKTHLRGPGAVLRSRLPDLVYQEIWAYRPPRDQRPDREGVRGRGPGNPDRISFTKALRLIRRTATGTADIPPSGLERRTPRHLTRLAALLIPPAVNAPAPAPSNAPATTTTGSRNPTNRPAPATPPRQPSTYTP
jgi:hypothetical protein